MTAIAQKHYTLEEYAEFEYSAPTRHYFYKGTIAPMAYASDNHELIVANIIGELHNLKKGTPYRVYPSNRMLYVPTCQLSYYPDAMVLKGEPQFYQYTNNMQGTLNPYAIFEVLSNSTEDKDRIDKWKCYRKIPSLQQYFMISQAQPYIDIYHRIGDSEAWKNTYADNFEQTIQVGAFDIRVADIYLLVQFPEEKSAAEAIHIAD